MDLRKLRYFVGVAEAGGFRRAAKNLHVAQPALSTQIRELEAEIGRRLLDRGRLGITLTPEGLRLLAESREIIERVDRLATSIEKPKGQVRGFVKIGAPFSVSACLFGPLARILRDRHPEIQLKCVNDTARLMDLLGANELDLAVLTRIDPDEISGPWHVDRLVREQTFLVGPKGAVEPSRPVQFASVVELPLVLSPMPHPRRAHMQRLAAAWGKRLNVAAEAGAISAQASFVLQGLGYAVMPFSAATLMKASGPLDIAPIEDLGSWRLLVRRGDRQPSQASTVVSEMIVDLFKDRLAPLYRPGPAAAPAPAEMDEVG